MIATLVGLLSGFIFALGLSISGMTNPSIVRGFLDVFGDWNFSLAFVMFGAVAFNFIALKFLKPKEPLFAKEYFIPKSSIIDRKLLLGSALFGVGWGLVGICPGPGVVNLATLSFPVLIFMASMLMGMGIYKVIFK